MDFDLDFEFDAPRWFDFADEQSESSLSDSWFERTHPLHEPKVPSQENTSNKPLLGKHESKTVPSKKTCAKPGQASRGKTKKSLGVKMIRTQRGEHGPRTSREHTDKPCGEKPCGEKACDVRRGACDVRGNSWGRSPGVEVGRTTPDEFRCDSNFTFHPPWTSSPSVTESSSKSTSRSPGGDTLKSITHATLNSPQRAQVKSPLVRPVLSPNRLESTKHQAEVSSPSYHSPKGSLLAKAISGAAQRHRPGGMKRRPRGMNRRLLPSVPPLRQKPEASMSPGRVASTEQQKAKQVDNVKDSNQSPEMPSCASQIPDTAHQEIAISGDSQTRTFRDTNDLGILPSAIQKSDDLPCPNEHFTWQHQPETTKFEDVSPGVNLQTCEADDQGGMSLEEMLRQHNQKIMATQCRYDENGRRIRSATPTFCPAPDKITKAAKRANHKNTSGPPRTSAQELPGQSISNASSSLTGQTKKLVGCSKEESQLLTRNKKARRSCAPSISTQDLLAHTSNSSSLTGQKRTGCSSEESIVLANRKQTRRSCVPSITSHDLSTQCVVPGSSLTGQKRASSTKEGTQVSAKQKRRSCAPSIGLSSNTRVLQPFSSTHQNKGSGGAAKCTTKQKRRSCLADIQTTSVPDVERELKELIDRHNSQIVAKKS